MRTVRTTMRPHERITVSQQEYTDLSRRGLLVVEPDAAPADAAPEAPPAGPVKGGGGGR